MKVHRFNWLIWAGFVLSVAAFLIYPLVFIWFPEERDFRWVSLLLFAGAAVLLVIGIRRAFVPGRPRRSKIAASVAAALSLLVFGFFILTFFIIARNLPPSRGAPQVGQKAPDFSLTDTSGKSVSLSELLASPVKGKPPRGVLLVFYRGYW